MANLEEILLRLLVPETKVLHQATQELKLAFKDPNTVATLCSMLCSSGNSQVRQYAAVLLRRKICKRRHWNKLSSEHQQGIKLSVLKSLQGESEKSVKNAVAQLAGSLAKLELPRNGWPDLLQFLQSSISSTRVENREVGVYVLSIVASSAAEQLQPHMKGLFALLSKTLQDSNTTVIPFYTIKALTALTFMVGSDVMHTFQNALPKVIQVIRQLVGIDEEKACEALQIFDELIESAVGVLAPHVKTVVELFLEIGGNSALGEDIRVKAITLISWLTSLKKKAILKNKLISPILKVLFPIMCVPPSEDDYNDEDMPMEGVEANSPTSVSAQVIDVLALHLPPEKLFQPLMQMVEMALASSDPYYHKAAYIALAVTAEGCADYIRNKYLQSYIQCTCKGIVNPHPVVRNAALFALGQFSEHLQPEIANYAVEILPLLFECLKQTFGQFQEGKKDPPSTTKMFYALENFCESLGEGLIPYVPAIMEQLFAAMHSSSVNIQELAISAIGATANAVKQEMVPYFDEIIRQLIFCLAQPRSQETMPIHIQSLDTLGVMARVIGPEKFRPLIPECIGLGLNLLDTVDDPDMRRCTYGLFASISTILKEEMSPFLPSIIQHMINSLASSEGVVVQESEETVAQASFFEDLSDEEEEGEVDLAATEENDEETDDDDDDDGVGYAVANAYLDEKEDTCCAFREIAFNTGLAFLPFLEKSSEEAYRLIDHPASSIRSASVQALGQFCCTLNLGLQATSMDDPSRNERSEAVEKMVTVLLSKLMVLVHEDKERVVAMTALEVINDLIKALGGVLLKGNGHLSNIVAVVKDVMQLKVACQDQTEDDGGDDVDDQHAEHDAMMIEYAGEIVPSLANVVPGPQFAPYFAGILSVFLPKMKRNYTVSEKSFSIGILAESVAALKENISPFVSYLYPLFLSAANDTDEEVRSNAIYGLGVLAEFGHDAIFTHYPAILQLLSNNLGKELDPRAVDNICAAVARMIVTNIQAVPIDQVFPVLLHYLPLRMDFNENKMIIKCLGYLFSLKHTQAIANMSTILEIIARITHSKQVDPETQILLDQLMVEIQRDFGAEYHATLSSLSVDLVDKLRTFEG